MPDGIPFQSIYPDGEAAQRAAAGAEAAGVNPQYPGMPAGAVPVHRDLVIAAAGIVAIWSASAPDRRLVLASAFLSSDAAMRVAIVDDLDVQGQRPVDQLVAANGGSSPNLVPVPYPAKTPGSTFRVVTGGAGNVRVRISGWEQDA